MNPYSSQCDDFGVYVYLNSKMELPSGRETVLHFFDSMQKTFPQMTDFDCRESGEYVLEENREQGSYRWVTLESRRICTGYVNPPNLEAADAQHERVLELVPYHLDFSSIDCEAMDVLFAFDFTFTGNHDEVVVEALGLNSSLENLVQMPGNRVINYEPSLMVSLDEDCRLQCRLSIRHERMLTRFARANSRKRRLASILPCASTGADSRTRPSANPTRISARFARSSSTTTSFQEWFAPWLKPSLPNNRKLKIEL